MGCGEANFAYWACMGEGGKACVCAYVYLLTYMGRDTDRTIAGCRHREILFRVLCMVYQALYVFVEPTSICVAIVC